MTLRPPSLEDRTRFVKWATIVVFLGLLGAGFFIAVSAYKEPSYEGRSYSSWLDEWENSWNNPTNHAVTAIRAIGSNGVPILLARLSQTSSPRRTKFWLFALRLIPDKWNPMRDDNFRAGTVTAAFFLLGPQAKSAFPGLTNLFWNDGDLYKTSDCLVAIGSEGIEFMLQALTNQDWYVRNYAARALGQSRTDLDKVIPALVEIAKQKSSNSFDMFSQQSAASSLVALRAKPELVVPVFVEYLQSPDVQKRRSGALGLRNFGVKAKEAIPFLLKARADVDPGVREYAESALKEIDSQAAIQSTNVINQ
jgi:hypothetical protein